MFGGDQALERVANEVLDSRALRFGELFCAVKTFEGSVKCTSALGSCADASSRGHPGRFTAT